VERRAVMTDDGRSSAVPERRKRWRSGGSGRLEWRSAWKEETEG
jgi:hypothetical protein